MEKIRHLDPFPKAVLLVTAAMLLVFSVLYFVRTSRTGFLYRDEIFAPEEEGDAVVYRGKAGGEEAFFRVSPDRTVSFRRGEKEYQGAVPGGEDPDYMTGAEILCGEEVLFRGGIYRLPGESPWLISEGKINEKEAVEGCGYYEQMEPLTGLGMSLPCRRSPALCWGRS